MSARIVAGGGDSTVAVLWVVFVIIVVVVVVAAVVVWRRYSRNRHVLRGEGLGPLSTGALLLGEMADRPSGAHAETPEAEAPTTPADVDERLREIADLHDRGILDDAEYERQRARMLNP